MNCDRIAPFYEAIEKTAFGNRLQKHRVAFLNAAVDRQRVLIVGDGDGRFTQELARAYPQLEILYVDLSSGMVAEARKRLATSARVRIVQGDAMNLEFPAGHYDAVFTHFFLDCFTTAGVSVMVRRLANAMTPEAVWIVSDFKQARSGWRRVFTGFWLRAMYLFFRYAAGLDTRRLPEYASALRRAGFTLRKMQVSMAGLIASEWWER